MKQHRQKWNKKQSRFSVSLWGLDRMSDQLLCLFKAVQPSLISRLVSCCQLFWSSCIQCSHRLTAPLRKMLFLLLVYSQGEQDYYMGNKEFPKSQFLSAGLGRVSKIETENQNGGWLLKSLTCPLIQTGKYPHSGFKGFFSPLSWYLQQKKTTCRKGGVIKPVFPPWTEPLGTLVSITVNRLFHLLSYTCF